MGQKTVHTCKASRTSDKECSDLLGEGSCCMRWELMQKPVNATINEQNLLVMLKHSGYPIDQFNVTHVCESANDI